MYMESLVEQKSLIQLMIDEWRFNTVDDQFWFSDKKMFVIYESDSSLMPVSDYFAIQRGLATKQFPILAAKWRQERNPLSSFSYENFFCPSYVKILGLGPLAVPLILRELEQSLSAGTEPEDWFEVLWTLTDEMPVPKEARGKIWEMASAWVRWGKSRGLI